MKRRNFVQSVAATVVAMLGLKAKAEVPPAPAPGQVWLRPGTPKNFGCALVFLGERAGPDRFTAILAWVQYDGFINSTFEDGPKRGRYLQSEQEIYHDRWRYMGSICDYRDALQESCNHCAAAGFYRDIQHLGEGA